MHFKYSDDAGATFTPDGGEVPGLYIGTYVDFEPECSLNPAAYTWARIRMS